MVKSVEEEGGRKVLEVASGGVGIAAGLEEEGVAFMKRASAEEMRERF